MRNFLILILALPIGACSTPEFRGSVASFGTASQTAATQQAERLSALTDRQTAQTRASLAAQRVQLNLTDTCLELARGALAGAPEIDPGDCKITLRDGTNIDEPETFSSIAALGNALGNYGGAIAALAADSGDDAAAFNKSLINLAGALDGLDAAANAAEAANSEGRAATATIFGSIGNATFTAQRENRLREIIIEADPLVQKATAYLSRTAAILYGSEIDTLSRDADRKQVAALAAISRGASTEDVATAQNALFEAVDALKSAAARRDSFAKIGEAHAALAETAEETGSASLKLAIEEVVALVQVVQAASEDL